MPAENLEEQGLEKNPNLDIAQWRFMLSLEQYKNDEKLVKKLMEAIETESK